MREKIGIAEVRVQQKGPFFPWVSRNKSGLRAGLQSNPLLTGGKDWKQTQLNTFTHVVVRVGYDSL